MEGGNVGFLPWSGEVGCLVDVVEKLGEEGQAPCALTFEHLIGDEVKARGLAIVEFFRWERISVGVMSSSMGRWLISVGGGGLLAK